MARSPAQLGALASYEPWRRRNLLAFSNVFTNSAAWIASTTISPNVAADPNGANTADSMAASSGEVYQAIPNSTAAGTWTASVWLKSSGSVTVRLRIRKGGGDFAEYGVSQVTATTQWQRFTFTGTKSADGFAARFYISQWFSAGTVYMYGAQVELGLSASDYQDVGPMQTLVNQISDSYHGSLGSAKGASLTGSSLLLPGTSGNYASTPDSAALSITGDIDIRVHAKLGALGSGQMFVSKRNATRAYRFGVTSSNTLYFEWSNDGTTALAAGATPSPALNTTAAAWFRVTLDVDNGAAGNTTRFYQSTDGSSWTLVNTVIQAGVSSIFDNGDPVVVGSNPSTTEPLSGNVYQAEIRNGIDGTIVANPRFDQQAAGTGQFADAQGNVWTVNAASADTNDPAFTGAGLAFATDDFVQRDDKQLWNGGGLSIFAVFTATAGVHGYVYSEGSSASNTPIVSMVHTSLGLAQVYIRSDSGAETTISGTTNLSGAPHSVAFVESGSGAYALYVDGRVEASGTLTRSTTTLNKATIGALGRTAYANYFSGTIHALDNFQTALRADQVAQLHEYHRRNLAPLGVTLPAGPAALRRIGPGITNGNPAAVRTGGVFNGALT
jgi:hypothetical protein